MGMRIIPIKVGNEMWAKSYFVDGGAYEPAVEIPHMMFFIEGAEKNILVDTGGRDPDSESGRLHSKTYTRTAEENPVVALKKATGKDPEDIDIVLLSHLHWDHCGNCHLFPNAEFYVQRKELLDSIDPIPRFGKTYESFNIGVVPPWAQQGLKWHFLDGDAEIVQGVKVYEIPGHSAGVMGIYVDTDDDPYFLGSDAIPLYDNIVDGQVKPGALCLNLQQAYYSTVKINNLVAETGMKIIPGHDKAVLEHKSYPEV